MTTLVERLRNAERIGPAVANRAADTIEALADALEAQEALEQHEYPPPFGHDCQWCGDCTRKVKELRRAAVQRYRETG